VSSCSEFRCDSSASMVDGLVARSAVDLRVSQHC
jgi:hypothetical protein